MFLLQNSLWFRLRAWVVARLLVLMMLFHLRKFAREKGTTKLKLISNGPNLSSGIASYVFNVNEKCFNTMV